MTAEEFNATADELGLGITLSWRQNGKEYGFNAFPESDSTADIETSIEKLAQFMLATIRELKRVK
jgi:hypothetical protein